MNTPLQDIIKRTIQTNGPISVAQYMALCLGHEKHGYYMKQDPFGQKGDFITAPEISQMFGELIGLWFADRWMAAGRPQSVTLIELGPGRGTLMQDMLRAMQAIPGMMKAITIHMVETSPVLKQKQQEKISNACWHERLIDVSEGFTFLIANEFFDALPVYQFEQANDTWAERRIGLKNNKLSWTLSPAGAQLAHAEPSFLMQAQKGDVIEVSPTSVEIMNNICRRLSLNGGGALIIDYGYEKAGYGSTLQALHKHKSIDVLDMPGDADLTTHVNFQALEKVARHTLPKGNINLTTQGSFLKQLGINIRAENLKQGKESMTRQSIDQAVHRLTDEKEMGTLFKVLGLTNKIPFPTPGFI